MKNFLTKRQNPENSSNSRYSAVYKCPLCGTLFRYGEPREIPYDKLPELCAMVVKNQMMLGNPYLYQAPMHVPHKCSNGNCGMAAFAGFYKET